VPVGGDVDGHPLLPGHARRRALLHTQTVDACLIAGSRSRWSRLRTERRRDAITRRAAHPYL
jgi:hypothetical protein